MVSNNNHYDLISLGSGEAGKVLAWHYASTQKKRCAVIERSMLGGSCPNVACLPSKDLLYSAKAAHLANNAEQFGLVSATEMVDFQAVKARKEKMIDGVLDMHREQFENSGAELIWGEGKFVGDKRIEVSSREEKRILTADIIIVDTGSTAKIPEDVPGLREAEPLTHVGLLELEELPSHLIVLGGGYVGLELAQAMRRFGAAVTVIERGERILKNEDVDVAEVLQDVFSKEGIVFQTSTTVKQVHGKSGNQVTLQLKTASLGNLEIKGSHILCAAGRMPNTANIGLDLAGIQVNSAGHIIVDEHLRTSAPGVFAAGDCAGSPYFTHMGFDDFRILRDILSGQTVDPSEKRRTNRQVPSTLFTDPEITHVGLREQEAQAQGIKCRLAKMSMGHFLRARTMEQGATKGFAKALISTEDDSILGFTAVGPHAGELLPVVQLAMKRGLPCTDIAELIIVHPTMNEGLGLLFSGVPT